MSETPENAGTPAPAPVALDQFGQMAKERLVGTINQHNALASRVKAASGDAQSLLDTLRENNDSPEAQKIQTTIDDLLDKVYALETKRDDILKGIAAKMIEDSKAGLGTAEAEAADLLKTINAGRKYLTELYGEAAVADLPKVVGKRSGGSGGGGGTGQRRIRGFDVYIDGNLATARNGKGEQTSNLAAAAKVLGVDTEDLRSLFWGAAGTDDPKQYPAVVEFTVSVNDEDGKQVTRNVVAKRVNEGEDRATEVAASA